MSDHQLGLVKVLGFIAWADQRISDEERAMLQTVMSALAIPEERRKSLCESLRRAPATLQEIVAEFDDDIERRFALAQAVIIAGVDGEVTEQERTKLRELSVAFGIDEDEFGFICEAVEATYDAFPAVFVG